jgi:alpha-amylase
MRRLSSRKLRILAAAGALALAGGITAFAIVPANASDTHHHGRVHDVSANLWEWNWPSVAKECTTVLGPSGYGSVQVAPPADSLSRDYTSSDAPIEHPWWDVYQPVDYNLTSRFGDEQQFRDMVKTCRAAGVKVIVDAVINHMTGQGHKSYGGVEYTHFSYPDYSYDNFHHLGTGPNDCDSSNGGIDDFNDFRQLTKCELLGLADLRTEDRGRAAPHVGGHPSVHGARGVPRFSRRSLAVRLYAGRLRARLRRVLSTEERVQELHDPWHRQHHRTAGVGRGRRSDAD